VFNPQDSIEKTPLGNAVFHQQRLNTDDSLVVGGLYPTHFFSKKIRPSLTTSKDGLRKNNIHLEPRISFRILIFLKQHQYSSDTAQS